jgi:hypothetical protein
MSAEEDTPENWRSAVDEKTGITYWYHRITRKSTWIKPACLEETRRGLESVKRSDTKHDVPAAVVAISSAATAADTYENVQLQELVIIFKQNGFKALKDFFRCLYGVGNAREKDIALNMCIQFDSRQYLALATLPDLIPVLVHVIINDDFIIRSSALQVSSCSTRFCTVL